MSTVNELAPTLFGLLQRQVMEDRNSDGVLLRRQEILGPSRFTMLIRCTEMPSQHLCGYVHTSIQVGSRIAVDRIIVAGLEVSYVGIGTRDISWRWYNTNRRLSSPGKVTPEGESDFWVGFDFLHNPELPEQAAVRYLADFERGIRAFEASGS